MGGKAMGETRTNYRKDTWQAAFSTDTDGRSGVASYTGHFTPGLFAGLHVRLDREPDRPIAVKVTPRDAREVVRLLQAFLATCDG